MSIPFVRGLRRSVSRGSKKSELDIAYHVPGAKLSQSNIHGMITPVNEGRP